MRSLLKNTPLSDHLTRSFSLRSNPFTRRMDFAIRTKLAVLTTLLIGAIAVFIFLFFPARLEDQAFDALVAKAQSIAGMTAFNIGPALFFDDIPTIEESLESARKNKDLAYLVVLDIQGRPAAAFRKDRADQAEFTSTEKGTHLSRDGTVYKIVEPVEFDGR